MDWPVFPPPLFSGRLELALLVSWAFDGHGAKVQLSGSGLQAHPLGFSDADGPGGCAQGLALGYRLNYCNITSKRSGGIL